MFRGSNVAIVTPFKNGRVDEDGVRRLVDFHLENGTHGIVACGTTGEAATLSHEEQDDVIDLIIERVDGRIPVIAGSGSNSTAEAIRRTKFAKRSGANGALVVVPYYNKPTQEGLYLHFKAVAEAVDIPLVLYNIASRTAVNIEPDTFGLLAQVPNIVAVKEASGNLEQMSRILQTTQGRLTLLSGDDGLTLPILAIGGKGVISVVANLVPHEVCALIQAFEAGRHAQAVSLHERLLPLVKALFIETNPVPVKTAMGLLGMIEPQVRLPLCEMAEANRERLIQALRTYGLLRGTRGKSAGAGSQRQRKPRSSNAGRRGTRPKVLVGS